MIFANISYRFHNQTCISNDYWCYKCFIQENIQKKFSIKQIKYAQSHSLVNKPFKETFSNFFIGRLWFNFQHLFPPNWEASFSD